MFAKKPLGLLESQIYTAIDQRDGQSDDLLRILTIKMNKFPNISRLGDLKDFLMECMKSGSGCDKEDLRIIAESIDGIGFGAEYTLISTSII